jgi:PAS domain S-box-containing protein
MPAIQYPFIDIAVHPQVRERFARGEATVLFSTVLDRVLWANGAGAELFGHSVIYDFLEQGAKPGDVSFRQIAATAHQLADVGDTKAFLIRVASGFRRTVVNATVEMIRLLSGEEAVLFSAPVSTQTLSSTDSARRMLEGFDDPDTHMAVIGRDGDVIAASSHFAALGITPQTAKMLINMAGAQSDRLIKRPIPTGRGYLPAALGKLSEIPALNLLFVVETATDQLDATDNPDAEEPAEVAAGTGSEQPAPLLHETAETTAQEQPDSPEAEGVPAVTETAAHGQLSDMLDAVAGIEDVEDEPEEPETIDDAEPAEADATADDLDAVALIDGASAEDIATASSDHQADVAEEPESAANAPAEEQEPESADALPEPVAVEATEAAPAAIPETVESGTIEPPVQKTEAAETAPQIEEPPATNAPRGFAFKPNGRATRFVWKIDSAGHFSEISHEFAEAVGPHATNVIGQAFGDIAALFNLDPDGKIAELLARRDTWSGRTIHWPAEGTDLVVPVDLAALPTYTRNREFDGFRGFGVVRLSDAVEDPLKLGLTLGVAPEAIPEAEAAEPVAPTIEAAESRHSDADDAVATNADEDIGHPDAIYEAADQAAKEDIQPIEDKAGVGPVAAAEEETTQEISAEKTDAGDYESQLLPSSEPPALKISESPNRRLSDKIIQLHEHRMNARDGLSVSEQAAFNEIARQLQPFGKRSEPPDGQTPDAEYTSPAEEIQTENTEAEDRLHAEATAETDGRAEDAPLYAASEEPVDAALESTNDNVEPSRAEEQGASEERTAHPAAEPEEDFNPLDVLNAVIPPRVKMTTGLSAETVDQMPVALLVHAGDRLIHANPELLRLTGYETLDEIDSVGGLDALLQRHDLEGKTERPGTMMVVRADDELIPVTARLQSIRWEDGSALMLALMPVDKAEPREEVLPEVREEARPERMLEKVAKLQVEVEELQSILETATDGVVIIGPDGDIRSTNRSASALFNYDDQETRGKPFVMLFAHESQKAVLDYLGGLSGHGVASVLNDGREVIGREASGGFVPLFMTMGKLTSSNGYCAVIRDITQWKRTEEELRNAKRAAETANAHKTDFLARVSHEIRTPLNAIIGFSDMMAGERFGPIGHSRYVEYANDIGRSGRHVLDIVNDLLDISKIEAGEMDLEFGAVGLNEAISEAVSLVQPQANSQRVIIRTALSQSVPNVVADLRSIKQIALNILSNAIRFTPSGGQIVVSTSYEPSGTVVMRIRDTGVGMTRTELEQAMKPFRQVSTNSRQRGDGTGLGLPLTKAMVDANRALFAIHSAPNEGTLVEITFPSPRVLAN